jgi:hypothetical protein
MSVHQNLGFRLMEQRRRRFYAAGVATHLEFTTQPVGGTSGGTLATQPVVAARRADGTTDTTFAGNVTVAINTVSGSHALGGTVTLACVAGVAAYTNLTDTGSGDATLTATATGLSSATSASFTTAAAGSVLFRDDATDANGTLVQSHVPTWGGGAGVGSGWTRIGAVDGAVQSNRFYGGIGSNAQYRCTDALGTNNQAATFVLTRVSTLASTADMWVRMSSDGQNGYRVGWDQSANAWFVRRTVGGVSQLVTGSPANSSDTWTTGTNKTVVVTINGSSLTVTVDGVTKFTVTDTTIATGQYIGWVLGSGSASGIHIDSVSVS